MEKLICPHNVGEKCCALPKPITLGDDGLMTCENTLCAFTFQYNANVKMTNEIKELAPKKVYTDNQQKSPEPIGVIPASQEELSAFIKKATVLIDELSPETKTVRLLGADCKTKSQCILDVLISIDNKLKSIDSNLKRFTDYVLKAWTNDLGQISAYTKIISDYITVRFRTWWHF
jgi:hypothetical protein